MIEMQDHLLRDKKLMGWLSFINQLFYFIWQILITNTLTVLISALAKHEKQKHTIQNSCPSASLDYIAEPWFLGPGSTSPGGPEFNEWADASKSSYGTAFATSIKELPEPKEPRCALISGRTADNPKLFGECIEAQCKTIFLEKPGAPTVRRDKKPHVYYSWSRLRIERVNTIHIYLTIIILL